MFTTTLRAALDKASTVTAEVSTGLGSFDVEIGHRFMGDSTVTLETGDEEYRVEFPLEQRIEVDQNGQAQVKDVEGEPHALTFEVTLPLAAEHF